MSEWYVAIDADNYISHHGILGQKWGIRRFQNPDGTLTPAGKRRYGAESVGEISSAKGYKKRLNDLDKAMAFNYADYSRHSQKAMKYEEGSKQANRESEKAKQFLKNIEDGQREVDRLIERAKSEGYSITEQLTYRDTMKAKEYIAQIPLAFLQYGVTRLATGGAFGIAAVKNGHYIAGTKYKVKGKGNSERMREASRADFDGDEPGYSNGMNWGSRAYQNSDGTLNDAGKEKYGNPKNDETGWRKKNK